MLLLTIKHLDRTPVITTCKGPLNRFTYNYIFHAPASNNVCYKKD